jgi:hypothetical protein
MYFNIAAILAVTLTIIIESAHGADDFNNQRRGLGYSQQAENSAPAKNWPSAITSAHGYHPEHEMSLKKDSTTECDESSTIKVPAGNSIF